MNAKWYFSALVIVLTFFGVSQNQQLSPNQQVVLQFANNDIASNTTQNTIELVKSKLLTIGAENIQISKESDGTLTIAYYSDINVVSIKKLLIEEDQLELNFALNSNETSESSFPLNSPETYNLDIYEIHSDSDGQWDYEGYVLTDKLESDRFFNPNSFKAFPYVDDNNLNKIEDVTYNIHKNIALAIDFNLGNIPEVRAGPIA